MRSTNEETDQLAMMRNVGQPFRSGERERRLLVLVAAVAAGATMRKNMPNRHDREAAAAEVVEFAIALEKASRCHFE